MNKRHQYSVIVVGGGISGTALAFTLARYTNIESIALFEKYDELASLNSNAKGNSQTIHAGDIETNYTYEKAKKVRDIAAMVANYAHEFGYTDKHILKGTKMAIGVGETEVEFIKNRYNQFKEIYPYLEFWTKEDLATIEPKLVEGREEDIVAMGVKDHYTTMDFGAISKTFIENGKKANDNLDSYLGESVEEITRKGDKFIVRTSKETYYADYVVVDAGAHSLLFAHQMGYGKDLSCLPVGGSFYFAKEKLLTSKVYTVQNPKLPFAAVHGDPDMDRNGDLRFGPTAIVLPKLERYHHAHFIEFMEALEPDRHVLKVFMDLLKDSDIRDFVFKNFLFDIPGIRTKLFVHEVQKIIPTIKAEDLEFAEGIGGLRPQVIDKKNEKLMLGEASIDTKEGIVFNMTPSPGATTCLGNALTDAKKACEYLGAKFDDKLFDKEIRKPQK